MMKKVLILILLISSLHAQAENKKDSFVEFYLGAGPAVMRIIPAFSLAVYGKHLTSSSNSYLGFVGINWSMLTILEAKYGYEFMRENTFSFGLDISGLLSAYTGLKGGRGSSFPESISPGFGGGTGIFVRAGITKSISILLRAGGWIVYNFYHLDHTPTPMLYVALGTRYHF